MGKLVTEISHNQASKLAFVRSDLAYCSVKILLMIRNLFQGRFPPPNILHFIVQFDIRHNSRPLRPNLYEHVGTQSKRVSWDSSDGVCLGQRNPYYFSMYAGEVFLG